MKRPIVSDPKILDGEPHIEGTQITIAEVQTFWRRAGVGAREIRARFPQLTEGELGAAVTYAPRQEPAYAFVADAGVPPRRRLLIESSSPGWAFYVSEIADDGTEQPAFDTWEESWERVLLYPELYAPRSVQWRELRSSAPVDIYAINPDDALDAAALDSGSRCARPE